jgi:hydroxyacylglutathione hydrolase
LLGDGAKDGLAREMYRSLHERIAALPDGLRVLPGHGAGSLCGAGVCGLAETTLGFERATNALFRLGEDEFVKELLASVPEMPAYYPRMKELNAKGAEILKEIPGGRGLGSGEVVGLLLGGDVVAVDVRSPEAFAAGHVAGATNLGAGSNFSLWAGWLLDAQKRIVLVGDGGEEEECRRDLVRVGLDGVMGYLAGGMAAWLDAGLEVVRVDRLSVEDVAEFDGEDVLVDVRSEKEWDGGHIDGAWHIPLGELGRSFDLLPKGRRIVTVCGSGYRASVATSLLERAGFRDVGWMEGGMGAWELRECAIGCS